MTRVRRKSGGTLARVREDSVRDQLKRLPTGPGVYLFRDARDEILYVGKAKSLRARVRSYFNRGDARAGIDQLVERIHRIEVIVTQSEAEALHLEQNLVKRHRPAVQRAAARRQVVPVHRGHGRRRVSAGDVHARAAPARDGLLRPVREREEGARDARRAEPRLPVPALRGAEARAPLRDPVPRLPHRAVHGAVHRGDLGAGVRRDHRRRDRVPLRRDPPDPPGARAADARGGRGGALRGGGPVPQPAPRDREPRGAAGGRQARGRARST